MIKVTNSVTGETTTYTEANFEAERTKLLAAWNDAKTRLEVAKEEEMKHRKAAVEFAFDQDKKSGMQTIELGNGYKAKAGKKLNYSFIKDEAGKVSKVAIEKALAKIEKEGAVGELIAERLVKWTPALSLTEYKTLSPKHKAAIDVAIVTTEGAPTLAIIPPKAK